MKLKKILSILLVLIMVLSLASCGNGGSGPSPVGTYTLTGMTQDDQEMSKEELDNLAALGMVITMEIKEDGTGVMTLFSEPMDFTWDEKEKTITVNDMAQSYTFDGTTLILEEENSKLTFTKEE